jgi:tRNA-Thr(GGU) m(6)t(6)A37 methyltransferase TsaA
VAHKTAQWEGPAIALQPIGIFRSPFKERADAPRQAPAAPDVEGQVELFPGHGYEDALTDLDRFDHLWLVFWFDRNEGGYRPKVQPPRSEVKRGVFATRAPYRPNPIGLSAVRLLKVDGLTVRVRGVDLLDGTPILDLKPYVPYCDAIPEANHGWLAETGIPARSQDGHEPAARPADPIRDFHVQFAPLALEQLGFLHLEHGLALRERIEEALRLGPTPHAYRRIRKLDPGEAGPSESPDAPSYVLALKDWRVRFTARERAITVRSLHSGYRPQQLFAEDGHAPSVHRAFVSRWATLLP